MTQEVAIKWAGAGLHGKHMSSLTHLPDCVFYDGRRTETTTSVSARMTIAISNVLSSLLELNLSITRGAGGAAISASYRCRNVVCDWDAPAFQIIHDCFTFKTKGRYKRLPPFGLYRLWIDQPRYMSTDERVCQLRGTKRELQRLFRQGIACPDDTTAVGGSTLLHVSSGQFERTRGKIINSHLLRM